MFTCVNIPPILELKVTIPQQYAPVHPSAITKDVTCIGEDDGDEHGEGDEEEFDDGEDDGDEHGEGDILLGDFLVKSK